MKPKAEAWLRESFRDGVSELAPEPRRAYPGAITLCWLHQHDSRRRPCEGRLERFHFISRQRVENALGAVLPEDAIDLSTPLGNVFRKGENVELILLAAWDPRNGGIGCEAHHRRFDRHMTPTLTVPLAALPEHVIEFARDYDFLDTGWFAERFPLGPS